MSEPCHLLGTITERDLDAAEGEFPGIRAFYLRMPANDLHGPKTFLELLLVFGVFDPRSPSTE